MEIKIDLKICFLCIAYLILEQFEMYIIFLIFISLHELAHTIIGIIQGFKLEKIEIMPYGLSIKFYYFNDANYKKKIITYLAGPVLNFILALVFFYIRTNEIIVVYCFFINVILGIANLLPILPLDGGKILKEILKIKYDYKKSYVLINKIGSYTLIILTVIYSLLILKIKNIGILLTLIYLWYLKILEEKKSRTLLRMYDIIANEKNEKFIEKKSN